MVKSLVDSLPEAERLQVGQTIMNEDAAVFSYLD